MSAEYSTNGKTDAGIMRLKAIGRPGANVIMLLHLDGTLPDYSAQVYCPGAVNLVRAPGWLALCWWNDALGYWLAVAAP